MAQSILGRVRHHDGRLDLTYIYEIDDALTWIALLHEGGNFSWNHCMAERIDPGIVVGRDLHYVAMRFLHMQEILRGSTWCCVSCLSGNIPPLDAFGIQGCPPHSLTCLYRNCVEQSMLSNNTDMLSRCPCCRRAGRFHSVLMGERLPDPRTEEATNRIRLRERAIEID